ncbi:MAG: hypothetical protein ACFFA5_10905 [Promethearchaeota archaeon]
MTSKPLRENLDQYQCYMPCPCLKRENRETICINGDEVHDIFYIDLGSVLRFRDLNNDSDDTLCLNMIYVDNDGFIRCKTSKKRIKLRTYHISIQHYLDALQNVKDVHDEDLIQLPSCNECLYKIILKLHIKRLREQYT